jgi:hypothetical protein
VLPGGRESQPNRRGEEMDRTVFPGGRESQQRFYCTEFSSRQFNNTDVQRYCNSRQHVQRCASNNKKNQIFNHVQFQAVLQVQTIFVRTRIRSRLFKLSRSGPGCGSSLYKICIHFSNKKFLAQFLALTLLYGGKKLIYIHF